MSNLEADLSNSRLIVANVEEKEYHFIVREYPIVGKNYIAIGKWKRIWFNR